MSMQLIKEAACGPIRAKLWPPQAACDVRRELKTYFYKGHFNEYLSHLLKVTGPVQFICSEATLVKRSRTCRSVSKASVRIYLEYSLTTVSHNNVSPFMWANTFFFSFIHTYFTYIYYNFLSFQLLLIRSSIKYKFLKQWKTLCMSTCFTFFPFQARSLILFDISNICHTLDKWGPEWFFKIISTKKMISLSHKFGAKSLCINLHLKTWVLHQNVTVTKWQHFAKRKPPLGQQYSFESSHVWNYRINTGDLQKEFLESWNQPKIEHQRTKSSPSINRMKKRKKITN